jgi:8-oxo-dGTP pyrophosphatase MutT (NUDIX family)
VSQSSTDGLRIRQAVRAIVRSPAGRVLLVRFEFPSGTRWALPGGGVDADETDHQALCRELHEELGLDVTTDQIGPHVWNRLHIVRFVDSAYDGQRERIFVVDIDHEFEPRPALTWDQLNDEYVFELRWWHLDEMDAASHLHFAPSTLPSLLRTLARDGPNNPAVDVPV